MKKNHITLGDTERQTLHELINKGLLRPRVVKRIMSILALDEGQTLEAAAKRVHTTYRSISKWRDRYLADGVEGILHDKPRSGRPIEIDGGERAKITALACSDAPEGHSQWSLRLLADKVVELGYCEHVSHTSVGQILKKRNKTPSEKHMVSG